MPGAGGDGYDGIQQIAGDGFVDLAIGLHHACSITESPGLQCWGDDRNGQTGDLAFARGCALDQPCVTGPIAIPLEARRVVVGERHSCALTSSGQVMCWGSNEVGQLDRDDAFLVGDLGLAIDGVVDISAGYAHTCALGADASVSCWGQTNR